jgi:mono/diheme cytochrome c family protein
MKKSALILVVVLFLTACASSSTPMPSAEKSQIPPTIAAPTEVPPPTAVNPAAPATVVQPAANSDGAALLDQRCSACHNPDRAKQAPRSKPEWEKTVSRMIGKGAQLNDAEKQTLVDYLAQTYGK